MTKDEALKLALSALNEVRQETFRLMRDGQTLYAEKKVWEAIYTIKKVLAQPQQEPVAWGVFEGNLHDMFFTEAEAVEMAQLKGNHAEVKPLYTAPHRTWVELTDDEIWEAYMKAPLTLDCSTDELYALARTVETKLKEKNGG